MTYLELCQRLRQEVGAAGSGPVSVLGQSGELQRLITWVNQAWIDIQSSHQDWDWLRQSVSFVTVNAQARYTPLQAGVTAGTFGMWARDSFRDYPTATGVRGEMFLDHIPYDVWRNQYEFGSFRLTYTRPLQISIAPDKSLCLGPIPTGDYTIVGDYYLAPSSMAADADTPALPTQFHMAIVYKAAQYYASYEGAPEMLQRGEVEFLKLMRRLRADRTPELHFAGALA